MPLRPALIAAAALLSVPAAHAATLTGDGRAWARAAGTGAAVFTGNTGLAGTLSLVPVTSIPLADGTSVTTAGDQPGTATPSSWLGYAGDIFSPGGSFSVATTDTLSPVGPTSLGFFVLPNDVCVPGLPCQDDTTYHVTVTVGAQALTETFAPGSTAQFVGVNGLDGTTSIVLSTDDAAGVKLPVGAGDTPGATGAFTTGGFSFGDFVDVPAPSGLVATLAGTLGLLLARRRR